MPTYTIDLEVPTKDIAELIETLRTVGSVSTLSFTIKADARRDAVLETIEVLDEFSATYKGTSLDEYQRDVIRSGLKRVTGDQAARLSSSYSEHDENEGFKYFGH